MAKQTYLKTVIAGSTIEIYNYQESPIWYDFTVPKERTHREKIVVIDEESLKRKINSRMKSMQRARSNLRRLVDSNVWQWIKPSGKPYLPVFVTLTFKEEVRDVKIANIIFSRFIRRLNYYITGLNKGHLKYVVVTEFQDFSRDGVIHYHAIFFNLPYIFKDTLFEIWEQGFIDIKKIDHIENVGAYISKYMVKHFEDDRLDGKKRYFPSRGLIRPFIVNDEKICAHILEKIPKKFITREKEYISQHQGKTKYRQYRLNKKQSLFDIIPELKDLL